jgi:hypothetical protein
MGTGRTDEFRKCCAFAGASVRREFVRDQFAPTYQSSKLGGDGDANLPFSSAVLEIFHGHSKSCL